MFFVNLVVEATWIPDFLIRIVLRIILYFSRTEKDCEVVYNENKELIQQLLHAEVGVKVTEGDPYEMPFQFFEKFLGQQLKYSACLFERNTTTIDEAELVTLRHYCKVTGLEDGMKVLDLGCGLGSLCMYIARNYPNCNVVGLTPSKQQSTALKGRAAMESLLNVKVICADLRTFDTKEQYDIIFGIEVFEYFRNYETLFKKISKWIKPSGKLFIHSFAHKNQIVDLSSINVAPENWLLSFLGRGGTLPSQNLFFFFQNDLKYVQHWVFSGTHYAKTFDSWLQRMDLEKHHSINILKEFYTSDEECLVWYRRWRFFCILFSEVFRSNRGNDFVIVHYLFKPIYND